MPSLPPKPFLSHVPGGVLSLSGMALKEFLHAVLARGKPFRFKTRGFSMLPFILDGDVITVSPLDGRPPRVGEVVACCPPATRKLVVHRVSARMSGRYLLRGDNAPESDGVLSAEEVLGLVTRVERDGRAVWLGLGLERLLISFLSRHNLLQPLIYRASQVLRPLKRRCPV